MDSKLQVRTVQVEFLRPGPAHNQLLSPLTPYLATCGNSATSVVHVPFEHAEFLRRLEKLQYGGGTTEEERKAVLRELGGRLGTMLGEVEGLDGALTEGEGGKNTLVHVRIVLSASELALLPFELAKMPGRSDTTSANWISLETRPPVCVTRRVRTVNGENFRIEHPPRVLFVAGDPETVPFTEHLDALLNALAPFGGVDERTDDPTNARIARYGKSLTVIANARFDEVMAECARQQFTHVHVLAHGAPLPDQRNVEYGIVLAHEQSGDDIVDGSRFANALVRVTSKKVHRPLVVTLASCNSGDVGDVVVGGASFAQALHASGIPFVLASQFPLEKAASVSLSSRLYEGLLAGESPWTLLHGVRSEVHGSLASASHDWASLVVYEALPSDLEVQLAEFRYRQSRSRLSAALEKADQYVDRRDEQRYREAVRIVESAISQLPADGAYYVEGLGLRASARKRLARIAFLRAKKEYDEGGKEQLRKEHRSLLEQSVADYLSATRSFLVQEDKPLQRIASFHWVAVQYCCLAAVLGRRIDPGYAAAARLSALQYLDHRDMEERAWAHGSLAELDLLVLATGEAAAEVRRKACASFEDHVRSIVELMPLGAFAIKSTLWQFQRYVEWWGELPSSAQWLRPGGLVDTAKRGIEILAGGMSPPRESKSGPAPTTATVPRASVAMGGKLQAPPSPRSKNSFLRVEMLPADHGDCLWIEYGTSKKTQRVLVDCGTKGTVPRLKARVKELSAKDRHFELFVLTHVDDDHIGGAQGFFSDPSLKLSFGDIWFNEWQHLPESTLGARQGEVFAALLDRNDLPRNVAFQGKAVAVGFDGPPEVTLPGGLRVTVLSPTLSGLGRLRKTWDKEIRKLGLEPGRHADFERYLAHKASTSRDVSKLAHTAFTSDAAPANGSSIAMLLEYEGRSVLLGADAYAPVLATSIRRLLDRRNAAAPASPPATRLRLDGFKVPHHGSRNNLDQGLLELLDCENYLVSTNGAVFNHPDREAIARIIVFGGARPKLHFNYKSSLNEVWGEAPLQAAHDFMAFFPSSADVGLAFDPDRKPSHRRKPRR